MHFPKPFIITVGSSKGGVTKTTLAANLAYKLGSENYKVLAFDLNLMPDLLTDVKYLIDRGGDVPFHIRHDPLGLVPGVGEAVVDLSEYDFVIADTAQWLPDAEPFAGTKEAWSRANLLLVPCPQAVTEVTNVIHAIEQFYSLGSKSPLLIFPTKFTPLVNSSHHKDYIKLLQDLGQQYPIQLPPNMDAPNAKLIDFNFNFQFAQVRFLQANLEGQSFSPRFLEKFNSNLNWVVDRIRNEYGELPKPSRRVSARDQFEPQNA